ncbi:MAG: DUF3870 domain-containing protein [Bacillota bacterium]|nr:DUF3870 domain-containing protein [Bacillota bacterium]
MEILLTGYAMLPKGITATKLYGVVGVSILIDKETSIILDFECSLATNLAKEYVKKIVVGSKLKAFEEIEENLSIHYYGCAQKAISTAIKSCSAQYYQIINNGSGEN